MWAALGWTLGLWFIPLFVAIGTASTVRDAAWFFNVRRSDPVAAYLAAQRRREYNYRWLAWVVYGPCVLGLILAIIAFVLG